MAGLVMFPLAACRAPTPFACRTWSSASKRRAAPKIVRLMALDWGPHDVGSRAVAVELHACYLGSHGRCWVRVQGRARRHRHHVTATRLLGTHGLGGFFYSTG